MAVNLSLFAGAGAQFFDDNGVPLSGGKIYTYLSGSTTPFAAYTSVSGLSAHTNPIVLDAAGRVPNGGEIWLQTGVGYKFVVKTSTEVLVATYDNIPSSAQPPAANDADSIMYEQGYTVTAGSFVIGETYRILTLGSTNFTLIGAASNTPGLHFIATGAGSGTGTAEMSRTVEAKLQESVSVKDFGAVGDGVADDTAAIQAALDAISNAPLTTAFEKGGKTLLFPEGVYVISAPLVIKSVNTILKGEGAAATVIQATSGTFATDTGPDNLGRWMVIWDANYVTSPEDLYNCHIFDLAIDLNNRNDVKGIWIGGGRNSSSIERVQWLRFYSHLVELGKSSRTAGSVTQGFLVSNSYAIWDGNPGQHTVDRDGELFIISSGNENVFFNVDVVSGSGETSIGTGFVVGNGSYQCGGNRFIGCGGSNFRAAHITVASAAGFQIGETVLTGDGYRATISSISGSTLKVLTTAAGNSAYVPRAADTITGLTSGASTTVSSALFGKVWKLANSWNTVVDAPKAIENSVCGVFMDNTTAADCFSNVVRGGRNYNFTSSCMVAFGKSNFNRCEIENYTIPVTILSGATNAVAEYFGVGSANSALANFVSTSNTNSVTENVTAGGARIIRQSMIAPVAGTVTTKLLQDYEEGTFTPAITCSTPGNLSISYSTQIGRYQRVGNRVTINVNLNTSSFTHTTASGSVSITGLPYTSNANVFSVGACGSWGGITKASYTQLGFLINTAQTSIIPRMSGSGQPVASLQISDMPTGGSVVMQFEMTYVI